MFSQSFQYFLRIIIDSKMWNVHVNIVLAIASTYRAVFVIVLVVFIDVIHYSLLKMNGKLDGIEFNPRVHLIVQHDIKMMQTLHKMKGIHFKLWDFKETSNKRFG